MSARPPAARLVLADGLVFEGEGHGAPVRATGEVVFNTSMTGYQEALTDPSYGGQILTMTYPLQGNYGVNAFDDESARVQARGFVVRELTDLPSRWRGERTLGAWLEAAGVPCVAGIDTRALARRLRSRGVVMGTITRDETPAEALARLRREPSYGAQDHVAEVSTPSAYEFGAEGEAADGPHVVVIDLGVKRSIMRHLRGRGCRVTAVPHDASAEDVLTLGPDGVLISPGPGDPMLLDHVVGTARGLAGRTPLMGICLGHQVLGRVFGASTYKLKFGHRGANHPVRDEATGRVYVTSQNHGYAVDAAGLDPAVEVSQVHLNDGTVEGMTHRELPLFTIQYHSEASPGPHDTEFLFDRFLATLRGATLRGDNERGEARP